MDYPRRRYLPLHIVETSSIAGRDDRGDLMDMSEPFSWQMPPAPSPTAADHHVRNEMNTERRYNNLHRASQRLVQAPTFGHADQTHMPFPTVPSWEPYDTRPTDCPADCPMRSFTDGPYDSAVKDEPVKDEPVKDEPVKDEAIKEEPTETSGFLWSQHGNATISYVADDGNIATISGVDANFIEQKCPLLAMAMEYSKSGPKLHLEAVDSATADPFGRFLSSGSYALDTSDGDIFESVPTSVLLHCRLYRLGIIYDLPDLMSQANVNIIRQCEFGCSSPDKPIDLCPAISFMYENLREQSAVIDTLINYCVSCFLQHRLDEDFEFRQLAYNLRPFHQDLCRNSMNREFENETASAIIQMPFKPYAPETYASREDVNGKAYTDVIHHFHGDDDGESTNKKRKRWPVEFSLPLRGSSTLRPITGDQDSPLTELQSDDTSKANVSRKRRSSSVTRDASTLNADSEPEYEMVAGPAPVEEWSSDCDSEAITFVAEENLGDQLQGALPIRPRVARSASLVALYNYDNSPDSNGSDSEWSLI